LLVLRIDQIIDELKRETMANPELIQGPVPNWQPSENDKTLIERLAASDNPLDNAYGEAYRQGFFVQEFAGPESTKPFAAVGELSKLAVVGFRLGKEIDPMKLSMGDCMELGALPGTGETRAESVLEALKQALEYRNRNIANARS
jgi:hypothetical protein